MSSTHPGIFWRLISIVSSVLFIGAVQNTLAYLSNSPLDVLD